MTERAASKGLDLGRAQEILQRAVRLDRSNELDVVPLSAEDLAAVAAEVGVSPVAVAVAVAEAQAGATSHRRTLGERLVGPKELVVARPTALDAATATRLTVAWLERGHQLKVIRSQGTVVARRRTDLAASVNRAAKSVRGRGQLGNCREVQAGSARLDDGAAAVSLRADIADKQYGAVAVGSGVGTVTAAGVVVGVIVAGPLVLLATPAVVIAGVAAARYAHRDTVRKVSDELERTVDAIATGEGPPTVMAGLGRVVRKLGRPRPA